MHNGDGSSSVRVAVNRGKGLEFLDSIVGKEFRFTLIISYTETAEIDGITVAGASKDLVRFTPPADAEFLYHGRCKCIDAVPATPDGKPTPALITRAMLRLANIPLTIVDSGSLIKPMVPHYTLAASHGRNIVHGHAMSVDEVDHIYRHSMELGRVLAKSTDCLIIGESIPAGTTTALAVMLAMGIDARFRVSSSMPNNPHDLKLRVVEEGMRSAGVEFGSLKDRPLDAMAMLGDPMMPCAAGLAIGAMDHARVILAGGTQMAAVLAIIKALHARLDDIAVTTTAYVVNDATADIRYLIGSISSDVPLLYVDPMLKYSSRRGLRAYAEGFVKEGVGAGGSCIAALAKSGFRLSAMDLLRAVEDEYEHAIEIPMERMRK
ncbi:MAG: TIGR00303 family protein [Candidatus Nitrosocaldus sp.]|nr:TIGR00303 family protein [Candidatus Nitrosocaldus sp.]MDW8000005.1 TIGR00303 family protein [Candidatus Nitrosocaldus sp.]